jgi:hypothetical protein
MLDSLMEPAGVIAESETGGKGIRCAAHLFCDEWHVDRQQSDFSDAAGAGRQTAAGSQLP